MGVGAEAASREKTCQASVENRSACCLYSCVAMLLFTEGLLIAVLGTHLVLLGFVVWCLFVCVKVLRPSQPNGVMSSVVSLPNHTFTGQA